MEVENRKHPRLETTIPVRFNLNPDHHFVPGIRKMGVRGTVRNVSSDGLLIDSRLDLLDLCQIFSEAMEDESAFELEAALTDSKGRRVLIRGELRWHRLGELKGDLWHFQGGLVLKDSESQGVARNIVESMR